MKNLLTALFFAVICLPATSQTTLAVRGGINFSTAKVLYKGVKQPTGYVPGANLGIQLKTAFDGPLHFSPFIGYNSRGFIIKPLTGNVTQIKNTIHYIDIAPLLSLDFPNSQKNVWAITFGPVLGTAFSGKQKSTVAGVTSSEKMKFSLEGEYGYFDFALFTGVSYQFKKIFIEAAYQYGLSNINNNVERDEVNIKNRIFSINLGYYLRSYK